jgi:hypothetical protein
VGAEAVAGTPLLKALNDLKKEQIFVEVEEADDADYEDKWS